MDSFLKGKVFFRNLENKFFAFFSKNGGISGGSYSSLNCSLNNKDLEKNVIANRRIACNKVGIIPENLIMLNQIHSNKVIEISQRNKNNLFSADAMITKECNIALGVTTADCAPIIFIGKKTIGIAHVGWKGLLGDIINKTITLLKKNEKVEDIRCFVGPHISTDSFEVKKDFISNLVDNHNQFRKFIKVKKNRFFFDYARLIFYKINSEKIKHYVNLNLDTYTNPKFFFSYRYNRKKNLECGRQVSIVGIRKKKMTS